MTSPIVITSGKKVSSSIYNEQDRFTNERHSTTIGTTGLPRLARALSTLIG